MGARLRLLTSADPEIGKGNFVAESTGDVSKDTSEISAKLSRYFEWPESSSAMLFLPQNPAQKFVCRMDYDRDEREPSVLHLYVANLPPETNPELIKRVVVRFETFRICYEFEADVVDYAPAEDSQGLLVVSTPEELTTYKTRRLPRTELSEDVRHLLPPVTWRAQDGLECSLPHISEIGLASLVADCSTASSNGLGVLVIGSLKVPARILRHGSNQTVFALEISDIETYGSYFEIYRQFAYPQLRPKANYSTENLWDLYVRTGYFSEFSPSSKESQDKEELRRTWSHVDSSQHKNSADYVIVNNDGELAGASSVSATFFDSEQVYWAFHQLCSVASPSLLEASGHLYTWRAEYLAARPGNSAAIGWFRSKSRWLERIYVKFTLLAHGGSVMLPIQLCHGKPVAKPEPIKAPDGTFEFAFGPSIRSVRWSAAENYVLGIGPPFLNASGSLDHIIPLSLLTRSKFGDGVVNLSSLLASLDSPKVYVTQSLESTPPEGFDLAASDRFFLIKKEDLLDFLVSVEHSIALTRRKYGR